jgi:deoxyribose-phosphate aldolase
MNKFSNIKNYKNNIDFTYIRPDATLNIIKDFCEKAKLNNYYAISVRNNYVGDAKIFLENTKIKIVSSINFPENKTNKIGNEKLSIKLKDIKKSILDGADEIDIPLNINKYLNKENDDLLTEVRELTNLCSSNGCLIKVIIESGNLNYEQLKDVCNIIVEGGAHYIMTSTGYGLKGAEIEKVKYIRRLIPDYIKIKSSGGIKTESDILEYLKYCDRIGTSSEI